MQRPFGKEHTLDGNTHLYYGGSNKVNANFLCTVQCMYIHTYHVSNSKSIILLHSMQKLV